TTVKDPAGNTLDDRAQKTSEVNRYREEVLEKEPGRRATRLRRQYEKAQARTDDQAETLPYQGKTVLIEKKGDKYRFRIEGGAELTGKDARFLDKEFNAKGRTEDESQLEKLFLPDKAVPVGASWKLDLERIAKEIGKEG